MAEILGRTTYHVVKLCWAMGESARIAEHPKFAKVAQKAATSAILDVQERRKMVEGIEWARGKMLEHFQRGAQAGKAIDWYMARMSVEEIATVLVDRYWVDRHPGVKTVRELAAVETSKYSGSFDRSKVSSLVYVAPSLEGPYCLMEGSNRSRAIVEEWQAGRLDGSETFEVMLGVGPSVASWPHWPDNSGPPLDVSPPAVPAEASVVEPEAPPAAPSSPIAPAPKAERMADWIRVYDDVISPQLCEELQRLHDEGEPSRIDEDYRRCSRQDLSKLGRPKFQDVYAAIKTPLAAVFGQYKKQVPHNGNLGFCTHLEIPAVLKYELGGDDHFHLHADNWNGASALRQVSLVVYLNDVQEGGRTIFPAYDIDVAPKRGRALLFPALFTYPHRAEPPVSESKYVLATWYCYPAVSQHYGVLPLK
jgi:prolyl 4-hydroxylase